MATNEASRRYAQAAFAIATDDGTVDQWRLELDDIATVLAESGIAPLFADDRIPIDDRHKLVERALDISPKALNLAKLLVSKGRSLSARFVAMEFGRMADEQANRVSADVTAAVELTADELAAIERHLSTTFGKNVTATLSVDPEIIGGVVVRVGDKLIDGSVRTRLRMLHRQLEGAA